MFVYPLLTLARMANEGILRCDLTIQTVSSAQQTQRIQPDSKLSSLLLFGIKFLVAIASTPNHPAHKHAETIRIILETGLNGWAPTRGTNTPIGPDPSSLLAVNGSLVGGGGESGKNGGNLANDLMAILPAEQFQLPSYLNDTSRTVEGVRMVAVAGASTGGGGMDEYLVPVSSESIFDPIDWEELEAAMDFNM